jgi:hypothetical protein
VGADSIHAVPVQGGAERERWRRVDYQRGARARRAGGYGVRINLKSESSSPTGHARAGCNAHRAIA